MSERMRVHREPEGGPDRIWYICYFGEYCAGDGPPWEHRTAILLDAEDEKFIDEETRFACCDNQCGCKDLLHILLPKP